MFFATGRRRSAVLYGRAAVARIPRRHARPADALAEEPARQQPHRTRRRRSAAATTSYADIVTALPAHGCASGRSRGRPDARSTPSCSGGRSASCDDDDEAATAQRSDALAACARAAGFPARRVPVRADRGGVRLRAHRSHARRRVLVDRRRRRHRRLHGHPAVGRSAGAVARPRDRRRPRQRRRPHRRHRLRFAPQHVVGHACARLPDSIGTKGPRRAEPRLLRPLHVASHQSPLRTEIQRRAARVAGVLHRSSPIYHRLVHAIEAAARPPGCWAGPRPRRLSSRQGLARRRSTSVRH